jgi:hypothetical protein
MTSKPKSIKTQCLVLNAGSSSLKYAVFDVVGEKEAAEVVSGLVEKIGAAMGALKHEPAGDSPLEVEMPFPDHRAALMKVIELLTHPDTGQVCTCCVHVCNVCTCVACSTSAIKKLRIVWRIENPPWAGWCGEGRTLIA